MFQVFFRWKVGHYQNRQYFIESNSDHLIASLILFTQTASILATQRKYISE